MPRHVFTPEERARGHRMSAYVRSVAAHARQQEREFIDRHGFKHQFDRADFAVTRGRLKTGDRARYIETQYKVVLMNGTVKEGKIRIFGKHKDVRAAIISSQLEDSSEIAQVFYGEV